MRSDQFDVFRTTFEGLEQGLRVKHIATFALETCDADALSQGGLSEPRLAGFDYVPITSGGRIQAVVNRKPPEPEEMTLHDGLLVSSEMPLLSFLPLMGTEPHFRLVLDGAVIGGIVTRTDLLKLPVRVLAFGLITHLEMVMAEAIQQHFGRDSMAWMPRLKLEDDKEADLHDRIERARKQNLDLSPLGETDFGHKAKIIKSIHGLGKDFKSELHLLKELRNDLAHAKDYAATQAKLTRFLELLGRAQHWIERVPTLASQCGQAK